MEAVKEMESVEKIQAINKTSWIQRMKSYKRTPLSFVLWLLVNVAMIATCRSTCIFDRLYSCKWSTILKFTII